MNNKAWEDILEMIANPKDLVLVEERFETRKESIARHEELCRQGYSGIMLEKLPKTAKGTPCILSYYKEK